MNANNTPVENNSAAPINLLEIWQIFWSRKILIIICAAVALILTFVKIMFFTPDTYSANGILYVSNRNEYAQITNQDDTVYGSDITTSRMMSTTYVEILTTRSFLTDVSNYIGGKYTWSEIGSMMSIGIRNETELLQINVRSLSAEDAYLVAEGILATAPTKLAAIFEGGEIKVVENAVIPTYPNDKGLTRSLLLSFIIGIAIGCAIAFVLDYFDTKIHRSDDIAKRYNVSILGEISQ